MARAKANRAQDAPRARRGERRPAGTAAGVARGGDDAPRRPRFTERQRLVLALIRAQVARSGYPPTLSELAAVLDVHKNAVKGHLVALKKKGAVDWLEGQARTLQLLLTEEEESEDEGDAFWGDDE